jgi:hypothetical protein
MPRWRHDAELNGCGDLITATRKLIVSRERSESAGGDVDGEVQP